jgi:hypothetical protein
MKNIAIALNAGTPVQRNEITKLFAAERWAYWHWVDDFWVVQVPDGYTVKTLHERIETLPNICKPTMLVFEFNGRIKYWGRNNKEAWDWLQHIGSA